MVTYLLKKSYRLKDLKEISFNDLWGGHGVFTTMWIFNKPLKILFFKKHIENLINSIKVYKISNASIKKDILRLVKKNQNQYPPKQVNIAPACHNIDQVDDDALSTPV